MSEPYKTAWSDDEEDTVDEILWCEYMMAADNGCPSAGDGYVEFIKRTVDGVVAVETSRALGDHVLVSLTFETQKHYTMFVLKYL